jgi:hypothetical protein
VTNDGTEYTQDIIQALIQDGWNVVIWNFPDSLVKVEGLTPSQNIKTVTQESIGKAAITSTVNKLRTEFGAFTGFIHLHPPAIGNGLFSDVESQLIKQVFFIASEIKNDLENSDPSTRKVFLSVTRTDGQLGIGNQKGFQEGNGLSGLVKTLNWEWPNVFCRSIDFSQEISGQDAGGHLLQEIHDPDRGLHEVGINTTSRVTIIRENG